MCGIFALVSKKNKSTDAAKIILEGLKKLEYRGYDSWGIAVKKGNKIVIDKHIGKIASAQPKLPASYIGFGHTRWATHGGVTVQNAHPFVDCSNTIALIHNGIIDNYLDLKNNLKQKHVFKSETDSEVLLHLIEELSQTHPFAEAVRVAFSKTQGLNAILVLHDDEIVAAKTGSPLVVGFGDNTNYVASDLWSILDHTRQVVFLEDGQLAQITAQKINFMDISSGKSLNLLPQNIHWKQQSSALQNYPHFMLKEIHEQPAIIESLIMEKQPDAKRLAEVIEESRGTFFVACGTASYAALAGQYLFSKLAHIHTNPAIGSEFIYYTHFLNRKSLVIALSQSGETIDTIQSVDLAHQKGATVACLVNVLGSTLYRKSDVKILLECGPEKAVASTKAFIAKVVLLSLTAGYFKSKSITQELISSAEAVKQVFTPSSTRIIKRLATKIKNSPTIFVVGRGLSYPAALEVALKIKEISYIHAEGLPGGELKHGPIALIESGTPCIVIAPDDETYHDTISGAMEMKARGGLIIGITPKPHEVFDLILPIKNCGVATIIPSVVVGQLLAYYLATSLSLDPDKPRNLAKSVTVK